MFVFRVGRKVGLKMSTNWNNLWHERGNEQTAEKDFERIVHEYEKSNMKLQLILVILPLNKV